MTSHHPAPRSIPDKCPPSRPHSPADASQGPAARDAGTASVLQGPKCCNGGDRRPGPDLGGWVLQPGVCR